MVRRIIAVGGAFFAFSAAPADAQGPCGLRCAQWLNQGTNTLSRCAPTGCGVPMMYQGAQMMMRQPPRVPPSATWQPMYRVPQGYRPPPSRYYYR